MTTKRLRSHGTDVATPRKKTKEYHIKHDSGNLETSNPRTFTTKGTQTESRGGDGRLQLDPPANLAANDLSIEDWERLEASQDKIPRFLFRAFGRTSGGDARLNTTTEIIPRAFLKGKSPTTIYSIPRIHRMVYSHFYGHQCNTEFSSWAACISIAIHCASSTEYVAIIDRTLLAPHVKIYHVPDIIRDSARNSAYNHEYLAYGPIKGLALRCVAYRNIKNAGYHSLAGHSYKVPSFDMSIFENVDKRVATAKKLAGLFRSAHDVRPDIIIALTAAFSSLSSSNRSSGKLDKNLAERLLVHLHNEFEILKFLSVSYEGKCLVNSKMYTKEHPQLQRLVVLLEYIENKIGMKLL